VVVLAPIFNDCVLSVSYSNQNGGFDIGESVTVSCDTGYSGGGVIECLGTNSFDVAVETVACNGTQFIVPFFLRKYFLSPF